MNYLIQFTLFICLFFSQLSSLHARPLPEGPLTEGRYSNLMDFVHKEALVTVNLPIELIRRELSAILTAEGTGITEVRKIDFDPIQRLAIFDFVFELPVGLLHDLEESVGNRPVKAKHNIRLVISLPSAKKLALTRYFSIDILELKIDGKDYYNALPVLTRFAGAILLNTQFVNFIMDEKEQAIADGDSIGVKIKELVERKNLRFRENNISMKLDLKKFADLSRFAEIEDIRLWQFSPVIMKGSKDRIVFRLEAGLGAPGTEWMSDTERRGEQEVRSLNDIREELYLAYAHSAKNFETLKNYLKEQIKFFGLENVNDNFKAELRNLELNLEAKSRNILRKGYALFDANPEDVAREFEEEAKEFVISSLTDIKRRYLNEQMRRAGGVKNSETPFLTARLGQDALNQMIRFFREFELNGELLFSEFHAIIAPQNEGLIIRGRANLDLNYILSLAFEGSGVEFGSIPLRASEDIWGAGIPFELSLRVGMYDNGELGLDIKSMSLFNGTQKLNFTLQDKHGEFIINFVKMILTQTLATTFIDQSAITDEIEYAKAVRENINKQIATYHEAERRTQHLDELSTFIVLARVDLETNPFLMVGKDYVAGKTELFFKDLIDYDSSSGLVKFKLDPRVVSDTILSSDNNVQVWNFETLFDKKQNNTFFEMSLGNGVRSKNYVNQIMDREEHTRRHEFTGVQGESSLVDLSMRLDVPSLEKLVNHLFSEAAQIQNDEANKLLAQNKESDHTIIRNISFKIVDDGRISLNITLSQLTKKRRGAIARIFNDEYEVKTKSLSLQATLSLTVDKLNNFKNKLKVAKNEIFLGDEVIRFDIHSVSYEAKGDLTILDSALNYFAGNLNFKNSPFKQKVKIIALKFLNGYLNSSDPKKNGNLEIGGIKINKYAKILTHDEEILIQIHPHIMTQAFDVKLLPTSVENGEKIGLVLDKKSGTFRFDFKTIGTMATVDKSRLIKLMNTTKKVFSEANKAPNGHELKKILSSLKLFDKALYSSDMTKPSLYHQYLALLAEYDGVGDLTSSDTRILNAIYSNHSVTPDNAPAKLGHKRISTSGVELMYFMSGAMLLKAEIDGLIAKVQRFGISDEVNYLNEFIRHSSEIERRFIIPLLDEYEKSYMKINKNILNKGPSDWNETLYPSALYSDKVYENAKRYHSKSLNKVGQ